MAKSLVQVKIPPELRKLSKRLDTLKSQKDLLEVQLKETNKKIDDINTPLVKILEEFKLEGIENVKIQGLGTVYASSSPYPTVKDEASLFKDLRKRKLGSIIKPQVHYQTLKALVTELLEQGRPGLDGVEVFIKSTARIRK